MSKRWQCKPSDYDYDEFRDNGGMYPIGSLENEIANCKKFIIFYQKISKIYVFKSRRLLYAEHRVVRELLILEDFNEESYYGRD